MPNAPRSVARHCISCTAHCPHAVWRLIARFPLPTTPRQCGHALQQLHYQPPTGIVAKHCSSSTTLSPRVVWACMKTVPLPNAPGHYGGAML